MPALRASKQAEVTQEHTSEVSIMTILEIALIANMALVLISGIIICIQVSIPGNEPIDDYWH